MSDFNSKILVLIASLFLMVGSSSFGDQSACSGIPAQSHSMREVDKIFTETDCLLQPGSLQQVTGSNCPTVHPWLTVRAAYQCEECGILGDLEVLSATAHGQCLIAIAECLPYVISITYGVENVQIRLQNMRHFGVCILSQETWGVASCNCPDCTITPVIISRDGNALELTSAEGGVSFDLDADGALNRTAWTQPGSDEAFLVFDRDGNGRIDDGTELFGNATPQPVPDPSQRNGFEALAVFDDTLSGGNEDGLIDSNDEIFSSLQLWTDSNHNGYSESDELISLVAGGVIAIELDYWRLGRKDQHGNTLRYASKIKMGNRTSLAWDVFFQQLEASD